MTVSLLLLDSEITRGHQPEKSQRYVIRVQWSLLSNALQDH